MNYIDRESEELKDYKEMLETEKHHNHKIIRDKHGTIRWEKNDVVDILTDKMSLNNLCHLLEVLGYGRNSEIYRKMYRSMGYSLSGYWEVFYWEANNEDAEEYKPNAL